MDLLVDRERLSEAVGLVAPLIPRRTTNPALQGVLLTADRDGCRVEATDAEVHSRVEVLGVEVREPGRVLLPGERARQLLQACPEESLGLRAEGGRVLILGRRSRFDLPTDRPELFPGADAPDLAAGFAVAAGDLRAAIRRTAYAGDPQSSHPAVAGSSWSLDPAAGTLTLAATDSYRMAFQSAPCAPEGDAAWPAGPVLVPHRALKAADRMLAACEPGQPVLFNFRRNALVLDLPGLGGLSVRLLEGRLPPYARAMAFPGGTTVAVRAGDWVAAVRQALVTCTPEARGVDFAFRPGTALVRSAASELGRGEIELPAEHRGDPVAIRVDGRFLLEPFLVLEPDARVEIDLEGPEAPLRFRAEGYSGCVMPLTPPGA